jgi:hypothetical protein
MRTTTKRKPDPIPTLALPDIIFAQAGAFSNGIVSIMAETPLSTLKRNVSSPVAGSPVRAPSRFLLPKIKSMPGTSIGSGPTPTRISCWLEDYDSKLRSTL